MQYISEYILSHFTSVFSAAEISIAYSTKPSGELTILNRSGNFFDGTEPNPPAVWWSEWKGRKIPFFFGNPVTDLITRSDDGQVLVQADIFASAFYLLSGWQEFFSDKRDKFDRYPYQESIQKAHNFVTVPVVNYYFDILRDAIELATGTKPPRKIWTSHEFTTCLTHDIDRCESGWKIAGIAALKQGRLLEVLGLLRQKLLGRDSWFNIRKIATLEKKHLARGTFFFLPCSSKVNGNPNADYDVTQPKYQNLIHDLKKRGHEVAVHGSFGTFTNSEQLVLETKKLPGVTKGNRFHYLQYNPAKTASVLEEAGLAWDSTLGFAEHFGFRNSYCLPFRPWDFANKRMHAFTELPLNLMDTTLRHPNYMLVEPDKIIQVIKPMLEEIIKFNGCFTLLWHNENFTGYHIPHDRKIFKQLIKLLQIRGAKFLTCSEAANGVFIGTRE